MSILATPRVFDAIELQIEILLPAPELHIQASEYVGAQVLSLAQARQTIFDRTADEALREAIWRQLVSLTQAREAGECEPPWQLIAVWLVIPGLRRTAGRLGRRSPADRDDIQAEMLLAFMEAMREVDPHRPELGSFLCRTACSRGWRVERSTARELPVEDVDLAARSSPEAARSDGLPQAPVRREALPTGQSDLTTRIQLEGERLGSVAQRLRLSEQVRTAAQVRTGGRLIGYLPLRDRNPAAYRRARNIMSPASPERDNR
ncbi:hypothetical protein [Saccharothrix sp. ST-888]|uniref:hypothetical protein n=1 Tax=Saccharothrix sp. ST-888 TaxID=1427391 RepID=UPI000B0F00A0|nr:hypothetical protein [Saccharothrix sp. ST-888]